MNAPFNDIMHGSLDRLNEILDSYEMDEQELRAALQNIVSRMRVIERKLDALEPIGQ